MIVTPPVTFAPPCRTFRPSVSMMRPPVIFRISLDLQRADNGPGRTVNCQQGASLAVACLRRYLEVACFRADTLKPRYPGLRHCGDAVLQLQ